MIQLLVCRKSNQWGCGGAADLPTSLPILVEGAPVRGQSSHCTINSTSGADDKVATQEGLTWVTCYQSIIKHTCVCLWHHYTHTFSYIMPAEIQQCAKYTSFKCVFCHIACYLAFLPNYPQTSVAQVWHCFPSVVLWMSDHSSMGTIKSAPCIV